MHVELAPHQIKAVNELRNGKVLWGGVGSGKSRVALAYYMDKMEGTHEDLYVITTAKKRDSLDWQREAAAFAIGTEVDATVAGVLTVDSWNNISKYQHVTGSFFIFDEQRLVGSGAWVKSFLKIARQNSWILLSATPGDTWLDYIPVFVANGFYKNKTEFKREHVVYNTYSKFPKVERYIAVSRLVKLRQQILVEMPYKKHTNRIVEEVEVDYNKELMDKVMVKKWHPYENRPIRDVAERFLVMRKVANSDGSRLEVVKQLLSVHPRLVVFYNFDYELEMLRTLAQTDLSNSTKNLRGEIQTSSDDQPHNLEGSSSEELRKDLRLITRSMKSHFEMAEWNGHKHEPIPKTDSWIYLVQYQAGSEGWNCTLTDAILFFSLTYSYKNFEQAMGRIDRMNTPFTDLHYYVLMSKAPIDKIVWRSLRNKKSFNEHKSGLFALE